MDPKHSGDVLKHLEKQKELLMDAYRSTSHELHSLQIEEEMLMRKYYEFMAAQGLVEKNTNSINKKEGEETGEGGASVLESRGDVMTNEPDLIIGEHRSAENANESTEMDQENGLLWAGAGELDPSPGIWKIMRDNRRNNRGGSINQIFPYSLRCIFCFLMSAAPTFE